MWTCVYSLDRERRPLSGNVDDLVAAIGRAADLRIFTEFRHNEHIDISSNSPELIREVADFRVTYLLDSRWVAGIINLRQPISLPTGFGPRPSMSFFVYNQNGQQAIARPYLQGGLATPVDGPTPLDDHLAMPKYHQQDNWDAGTNAPSENFIYDFDVYRFCVSDDWSQKLEHSAEGSVISGSVEALVEAFAAGCEVKVGVAGLCGDLSMNAAEPIGHEVFVHCGSCYYYTEQRLFIAGSHPLVRVRPAIPLRYTSEGWDFGWVMLRTDGFVAQWLVDPYTLKFRKRDGRYRIRWFVR
jgi:hypothetical protein